MEFKLRIIKQNSINRQSKSKFSFAVVNCGKSESYPSNFICILPRRVGGYGNQFEAVFGDKSLQQAQLLLKDFLENNVDNKIKAEVDRRIKLLELQGIMGIKG